MYLDEEMIVSTDLHIAYIGWFYDIDVVCGFFEVTKLLSTIGECSDGDR